MNAIVDYLKNLYEGNSDFITREIESGTKDKIYVIFFESLVDSNTVFDFSIKIFYSYLNLHKKIKDVKTLIGGPKLSEVKDYKDISYYLENGFAVIIQKNKIYAIETKAALDRGVTISDTEPSMYGPKDSFCENYQKNIGLLKRRIKNNTLKIDSNDFGKYTKTRISLVYIDGLVKPSAIKKVKKLIKKHLRDEVIDSSDVTPSFEQDKIFPTIYKSEKPSIAARYLLSGHMVILIDNTPFTLILDSKFKDFVNPHTTDKFVRVLRFICIFLTIMTPALYVAFVNFNQETIPTSLLISISGQQSGVPFPVVVEAFLMLFICEILRESDIRFPSAFGSSASILGALVLGEASVNAGIVSPIMIIVVAISFITNLIFTEIKLVNMIRILRYSFLVIAAFLGLYGIIIGLFVAVALLCNTDVYEGDYL